MIMAHELSHVLSVLLLLLDWELLPLCYGIKPLYDSIIVHMKLVITLFIVCILLPVDLT